MSDTEDEEGFEEVEQTLEDTCILIETMLNEVTVLEQKLFNLQRPIQNLHIEQLGDLEFLASSPFRQTEFRFAKPEVAALAGLDIKKRHTFHKISECLRDAIIAQKCVDEQGIITLSKPLQKMFETKDTSMTFPALLGHLRSVLV
jgi:hypothetical protein